jgi:hypothetical protein
MEDADKARSVPGPIGFESLRIASEMPWLDGNLARPWPKRYAKLDIRRGLPPNPRRAFFVNGAAGGAT